MKIAVIGVGYVGLPLALSFSQFYNVIGYDINADKIAGFQAHQVNFEIPAHLIDHIDKLTFTTHIDDISEADCYIITVPTPVSTAGIPEMQAVSDACKAIGQTLKKGNLIIVESTVYPGATETHCLPILERESGLTAGQDFDIGFSPERMNPGDELNHLEAVVKIVSGLNERSLDRIESLYKKIIPHVQKAPSIKTAECAKLLENTQRDVNIALVNEMSALCESISVDMSEVLKAAKTKWNFHAYQPGMVGGHCIGVDPYYLLHAAKQADIDMPLVSTARVINEQVVDRVAKAVQAQLSGLSNSQLRLGIMGATFKENCQDVRNAGTLKLAEKLRSNFSDIVIYDPVAVPTIGAGQKYTVSDSWEQFQSLDVIIVAVAHDEFSQYKPKDIQSRFGKNQYLFDLKRVYSDTAMRDLGIEYWGL